MKLPILQTILRNLNKGHNKRQFHLKSYYFLSILDSRLRSGLKLNPSCW